MKYTVDCWTQPEECEAAWKSGDLQCQFRFTGKELLTTWNNTSGFPPANRLENIQEKILAAQRKHAPVDAQFPRANLGEDLIRLREQQDKIILRKTLEGLVPMMRTQSEVSPTWGKAVLLVEKILRETP